MVRCSTQFVLFVALTLPAGHSALHQTQKYLKIAQADVKNKHRQFSPGDEF